MSWSLWVICAFADINSNLVLHYSFEGNGNDSIGGHHLETPLGSPNFIEGPFGLAVDFKKSAAYFKSINNLPSSSQLTWAFWVKAGEAEDYNVLLQTVSGGTDSIKNVIDKDQNGRWRIWGDDMTFHTLS